MGFGGYPAVSLKQASETAEHWRVVSSTGHDPVKVREKEARERAKAMFAGWSGTRAAARPCPFAP
jgi:hypothetical protein